MLFKVFDGLYGGDDCGEGDIVENGLDSCESLSNVFNKCDFFDLQYVERGMLVFLKNIGLYCVEI